MTYYVKVCYRDNQNALYTYDNKYDAIKCYDYACRIKEEQFIFYKKDQDAAEITRKLSKISFEALSTRNIASVEYGEAKLFPIFKTQEKA